MLNKTIFLKEIKRNKKQTLIWSAVLVGATLLMMAIFPMMGLIDFESILENMDIGGMGGMMGLEMLKTTVGYFGSQVLSMIQLAFVIYAALISIKQLSGEEKNKTAEFLLSHPISRNEVWTSKFFAVMTNIVFINVVYFVLSFVMCLCFEPAAQTGMTGADVGSFWVMALFTLLLCVGIACACYFASSYLHGAGMGVALGIGIGLYFFHMIAAMIQGFMPNEFFTQLLRAASMLSPFHFANPMTISAGISGGAAGLKDFLIDSISLVIWIAISAVALIMGRKLYNKKDI